jgi:predicted transcriptional regulator
MAMQDDKLAGDVMRPAGCVLFGDEDAQTALAQLRRAGSSLLLTAQDDSITGVVNRATLERFLRTVPDAGRELVGNLTSSSFSVCRPDDPISVIRRRFALPQVQAVVVSDADGRLCGVITRDDVA